MQWPMPVNALPIFMTQLQSQPQASSQRLYVTYLFLALNFACRDLSRSYFIIIGH